MFPRRRLPVVARRPLRRATVANPYLRANRVMARAVTARRRAYPRRTYAGGRRYTMIAPRRYVTYG